MIYELRTYTCKQGTVADIAKAFATVAAEIRKDDYGKLEGFWITEIGPLNQVVHLWSYRDVGERQHLRAELAKIPRWNSEFLANTRPHYVRQDNRLLNGVIGPVAPASGPNFYEMRNYRVRPGALAEWVGMFRKALLAREKYSKIVGLWTGEAGQPNEVLHIWAYPDLNARVAARAAANKDPDWQQFIKDSSGMLDEMQTTIMVPGAHSPLK